MANPRTIQRDKLLSRGEIKQMIADGRKIIILQGKVLKVDAWLKFHPGGDKAILHMVGRDATDEALALHSEKTVNYMFRFQIGRIAGPWQNFVPPIQGGQFQDDTVGHDSKMTVSERRSSVEKVTPKLEDGNDANPRHPRESSGNAMTQDSCDDGKSDIQVESIAKSNGALAHLDALTKEKIDLDLAKYPAIDRHTQEHITSQYRALSSRMHHEGLFQCPYTAYAFEIARYLLLFSIFFTALRAGWFGVSGLSLGLLWHQLVFTAHDAGHMGITHDFHIDSVIGIVVADFIGGLSLGWWKNNHNVHHIVTNSPEHDPDIEHMPFFAVSHRFLDSLKSTYYDRVMPYDAMAKWTIRIQHYLYYPILLLGRFNLYRLSWAYLILGKGPRQGPARWHRWLELVGQIVFWYWFGYLVVYRSIPTPGNRWLFVLTSHMVTAVLHVQITLSHFAMSTADLGVDESFPQKMLRTTMDIDCPRWLDFFHGGLQFQAIHHLFPRMPRHNLRRAQKLVQEFCREVDIPYALYGFVDGNKAVIGHLAEVGRQAAILAQCQKTIVASSILTD